MAKDAPATQDAPSPARHWTLAVVGGLLVLLGLLFLRIILPYLLPLFLALVVAIIVRPQYEQLRQRLGGRDRLAALLLTTATVTVIVVPLVALTTTVALRLYVFWLDTQATGKYDELIRQLRETLRIDTLLAELQHHFPGVADPETVMADIRASLPDMVSWIATRTLGVATTTFGLLGGMVSVVVAFVIFVFALYYFLAEGPVLLQRATAVIPLPLEYQRSIFDAFTGTIRGAIAAMFAGALMQAFALGLGLFVLGVPRALILTFLAVLACFIPFVGSSLVWVPTAVWLWLDGSPVRAVLLTLYSVTVVSSVDNLVRIYVMQGSARLHPLLALVSILGGIGYFGLWGIFVGPLAASCLYALAEVFKQEYSRLTGVAGTESKSAEGPKPPPKQEGAGPTPTRPSAKKQDGKQ